MSTAVEAIESAILKLSPQELGKLADWVLDLDKQNWDKQIERDVTAGKSIPDIGVFVLTETAISLDYRMGEYWNTEAVEGLFEIMSLLKVISYATTIEHIGNYFDYEGTILISVFNDWIMDRQIKEKI